MNYLTQQLLNSEELEILRTNLKENEFFFDYLKKEIKDKRKMGHITILV